MEILVSLAVLSIVTISAVKASGNAVNNIHYLKHQSFGHWVLLNKAVELEMAPPGWEHEKREGTDLMADRQWFWAFEVHNTQEAGMRRVELAVWPGERRDGEPVALLTMFRRR